jgi:hypothetical protein
LDKILPVIASRETRFSVRTLLLVLVTLVGAGYAALHAVTNATRASNPEFALQLVGSDPVALALKADVLLAASPTKANAQTINRLARQSLLKQAVNPRALRILGYHADLERRPADALAMTSLAAQLSRRDAGAQIWLIEKRAAANDVKATLVHYDIALRTSLASRELLFPILATALSDPAIQSAFVPYVKRAPEWLAPFLGKAIWGGGDPSSLANVIIRAGGLPQAQNYRELEYQLLGRLIGKARFVDARRYFLTLPGANGRAAETAGFDASTINPQFAPIAWELSSDAKVAVGFLEGNRLHVAANSGTRLVVARKLLFLKPGRRILSSAVEWIAFPSDGEATWRLMCEDAGKLRLIWSAPLRGLSSAAPIDIPGNCTVQFLDLAVAGGSAQTGVEFILDRISLNEKSI